MIKKYETTKVCTRLNGKLRQNPRVVVTILIANAKNATMQHSKPHNGGLMR